jgi:putative peptide zinc metalloprotease protein
MVPNPMLNNPPAHSEPRLPGGLWGGLRRRAAAGSPRRGLWVSLNSAPSEVPTLPAAGIYKQLAQRTDMAKYRPQAIAGIAEEQITEGNQTFTVIRSPNGSYLRLNAAERELWHLMDGSQNVAQLATVGFLRFKQLLPVASLVQSLKSQGFLTDSSLQLYENLAEKVEAGSAAQGWGQWLVRALRSRTFAIEGIDGFVGALYRFIGWICFTKPFLLLHGLISVAGLIAFFLLLGRADDDATYAVLNASNVPLSLFALWGAMLLSFTLHELAHALAVKHYGRTVHRGGVMIYYGMPAAFVDTSDIWLAGRTARIVVTLAGPLADILLGGVAALLSMQLAGTVWGAALFKIAFACYISTLFNFNPLLELDGYFILADWLRLPNLRQRALNFVSGPLWTKLRGKVALNREERIFALYGALTAAYTAFAIVLTLLFWRDQFTSVLGQLWNGGLFHRSLAVLIFVAVVIPLFLGLIFALIGLVRAGAQWLGRRNLARSPAFVAAALAAFVVVLALQPLRYGVIPETALLGPGLWLVALVVQLSLRNDYQGAHLAPALNSFLVVTLLSLLSTIGRLLNPALALLWATFELSSFLLLMYAGFVALIDVDLRQSPPQELIASAIMLVAAFVVGGGALDLIERSQPGLPFLVTLVEAAPIYLSAIALALLLPHLIELLKSRLVWAWAMLWVGIALQTVAYLLELLPPWRGSSFALSLTILASGLWAGAWCVHYVTLRRVSPRDLNWPLEAAISEAVRLKRAFQLSYAGCYRLLRDMYGRRRAKALDDRMDIVAATANWDVTLDRDTARVGASLSLLSLDQQGARYAEVLRYTVDAIEALAGASFARRTIRAAYDALPWPEREAADRRCFPNTPWASELSRSFGNEREARLRLLRQVEVFATCDDGELAELSAALQVQNAAPGEELLAANVPPPGVWIVEAGEIAAMQEGQLAAELHRGACFGEVDSVLGEGTARRSYRATVASTLLFLPSNDFQRLLGADSQHTAEGLELLRSVRILERIPLFRDVSRGALRNLAMAGQRLHFAPRSVVVREGQRSGIFYVITNGHAAVVVRSEAKGISNGATNAGGNGATRRAKVVARLGAEEFFGEVELLRGTPPMASVLAIDELDVLALPHDRIAGLVTGSASIARSLEQISTGRLLELRQRS